MNYIVQIIIQLIISVATITVAIVSAKSTAKQELLKRNHEHFGKVESDFSDMCKEVSWYLNSKGASRQGTAATIVGAVRPYFDGKLGDKLDELQKAIISNNWYAVGPLLDKAISLYRDSTSAHKNSNTSKRRKRSK